MGGGIRRRLTYANVVSTLALFMLLSGGVVYAAAKLSGKQIQPRSISASRFKADSLKAEDFARQSIGAEEIDEAQLGVPRIVDRLHSDQRLELEPDPRPYPLDDGDWSARRGEFYSFVGLARFTLAPNCPSAIVQVNLYFGSELVATGAGYQGRIPLNTQERVNAVPISSVDETRSLTAEARGTCNSTQGRPVGTLTNLSVSVIGYP